MDMRQFCTALIVGILALSPTGGTFAKEMTPLDIPMIGDIEMLQVGDKAPDFTLTDIEGNTYTLGDNIGTKGKGHLLVFWSIFCEPCKEEMPLIQHLYETYNDQGLEVLAIAMDGEPMKKSIQGYVRQQNLGFRVFIDELAEDESFVAADPYGVAGTPTIYVLDRQGRVVFAKVGLVSKQTLEEAVQKAIESE